METAALLITALLFGGMVLYAFGFAAFVFSALPAETAGPLIRQAFPHFYLFVIITGGTGAAVLAITDAVSALLLAITALSTIPIRQNLMPAINAATDAGNKGRFRRLHGVSVAATLAHIGLVSAVLIRFVN